ncbi:hypothetical protein H5410_027080, partial [Solanum commersonii]
HSNTPSPQSEATNTTSSLLQVLAYELTPTNFSRLSKWVDKHKKKLKLLAEQLGPFVDRALPKALYPYSNMHARMNAMEAFGLRAGSNYNKFDHAVRASADPVPIPHIEESKENKDPFLELFGFVFSDKDKMHMEAKLEHDDLRGRLDGGF